MQAASAAPGAPESGGAGVAAGEAPVEARHRYAGDAS